MYKTLALAFALLLLQQTPSVAQAILEKRVVLPQKETSLLELFLEVEKQTQTTFAYGSYLNLERIIELPKQQYTVRTFLDEVLKGTYTAYKERDNKIIIYPLPKERVESQESSTISGFIKDSESGETLIGASIYDAERQKGTLTNLYGFFSYTFPNASVLELRVSFLGYKDTLIEIGKAEKNELTIYLSRTSTNLGTVEVTSTRQQETQMSQLTMSSEEIAKLPRFMGEPDVIKTLTLMPGVKSGNDNTGGIYVRGGGPDQNLILLDGATIYNSAHAFDLFSTFNNSAIKHVDLIKGGFPARYGGRLSSVIDARMRDGNLQRYTGEVGVGYLLSKFTFEGPIVKNKSSFILTGRRTMLDGLTGLVSYFENTDSNQQTQDITFQDFNAKVNYSFSDNDRVYLSFYNSGDAFVVNEKEISPTQGGSVTENLNVDLSWANKLLSARWNHLFNNKLFSNTTLTYSRFNIGVSVLESAEIDYDDKLVTSGYENHFSSLIKDYGLRTQFDYFHSTEHNLKFGINSTYHQFEPGFTSFKLSGNIIDTEIDTVLGKRALASLEWSLFVEDEMSLGNRTKLNVGLHYANLHVDGKLFPSLQPRLALSYQLSPALNFNASYAHMAQFIHLLTNNTLGVPLDLWVPATSDAPPMRSRQLASGLKWTSKNEAYEISIEGYYKTMDNLITYKEGVSITSAEEPWEEKIEIQGEGKAYGTEFFIQRLKGRTTGWIGYTLALTERQFETVNLGLAYPYKYDRRHDFSFVLSHELSEQINFSGSWIYSTGNAVTFPHTIASSLPGLPNLDAGQIQSQAIYLNAGRNAVRMPNYHRMDVGINFVKKKRKGERTWNLSVYNTYMRKNAFFIFPAESPDGDRHLRQISAFWIVPSISYLFKFN